MKPKHNTMAGLAFTFLGVLLFVNGFQCNIVNDLEGVQSICEPKINDCFLNRDKTISFENHRSLIQVGFLNILTNSDLLDSVCRTNAWLKSCVNDENCDTLLQMNSFMTPAMCEHAEDIRDSDACWTSKEFQELGKNCSTDVHLGNFRDTIKDYKCIQDKIDLLPMCSDRNKKAIRAILDQNLWVTHIQSCIHNTE